MKNFFKPEDFETSAWMVEYKEEFVLESIAEIANAKLEKLIESWPVVYGYEVNGVVRVGANEHPESDTHKARLAFIEPLLREPCKHEPFTKGELAYKACTICGIELIATWSAK